MKRRFLRALSAAICLVMLLTLTCAVCEESALVFFNNEESNVYDLNSSDEQIKIHDTVTFGSYPQGDGEEKSPIEWIVLDIDEYGYYVLISKDALDRIPYQEDNTETTWEYSSLRAWLNGDFYKIAFNAEEQARIRNTPLINAGNPVHGTDGGNDTTDRVYLLSFDDITRYYDIETDKLGGGANADLACKPTQHAIKNGAEQPSEKEEYLGNCRWWLRTPGKIGNDQLVNVAYVNETGNVYVDGTYRKYEKMAVRPVIRARRPYAPELSSQSVKGDVVSFGSYPQGVEDEIRPIEWTVLDTDDTGNFVLISNYALAAKPYNEGTADITWEDSTLRKWLNEDFYEAAFNEGERSKILKTKLTNSDNPWHRTNGGGETEDSVYILSLDDITLYYGIEEDELAEGANEKLECMHTEYAIKQGSKLSDNKKYSENCQWWLRTPGEKQENVCYVNDAGKVQNTGTYSGNTSMAVRPVVRVRKPYAPGLTTDTRKGDFVSFGSYPQDANGAKEPIEWQVLAIDEEGYYVLISIAGLDVMPYNEEKTAVTWENCTLRAWLNDEFYRIAFDEEERERIKATRLTNGDNTQYSTPGGGETEDKVYVLSLDEIHDYYAVEDVYVYAQYSELLCKATGYAGNKAGYTDWCSWWLRSPGSIQADKIQASTVNEFGYLNSFGSPVTSRTIAVRPVVRVKPTESITSTIVTPMALEIPHEYAAGDTLVFGNYPQGVNGEIEPIEWTVLDMDEEGYCVLISRYALDTRPYNETDENVTWQECSLRKWLNKEFLNTAFDENERKRIKETHLINSDSIGGTPGGDTDDWVYLLSLDEITYYYDIRQESFSEPHDGLYCMATEYAKANGAWTYDHTRNSDGEEYAKYDGNCWWWLRSPGRQPNSASDIGTGGGACPGGCVVYADGYGISNKGSIRPVIRVYLQDESFVLTTPTSKLAFELTETLTPTPTPMLTPTPSPELTPEPTTEPRYRVGDIVKFGEYYYDENGVKAPIEWIVLDISQDGYYVLISKYGLDAKAYNEEPVFTTWENCTLRKWLNDEFYKTAFNANEQGQIILTKVVNSDNSKYGIYGGGDTQDNVYLLSLDEVNQYFKSKDAKKCTLTGYAIAQEAYIDPQRGTGRWWLRTPGDSQKKASSVGGGGGIHGDGYPVESRIGTVRPVIQIRVTD